MLFRPAESSEQIVDFYRNYLLTTFKTSNDVYNEQLEAQLKEDGTISSGPFISVTDSYEKANTIKELVDKGVLCKSMLDVKSFDPYERKLYKHQVKSILNANEKKNIVITTGTGSGKTECFLLPVVNELLKEQENGTLDSGIRTLIIYPMNALVNDQIRRLRELFKSYDGCQITYGKFTGETDEDYDKARNSFVEREGEEPPENELISRKQMRDNPPNILITNYAMLEYILLRPGDNVFFNDENASKWRSIVLDEAHTYGGAKGIEVGTLLKRVQAKLNRNDIQFMLTSATLGDENSNKQIIDYAESLCGVDFEENAIIRSTTVAPPKPSVVKNLGFGIYNSLSEQIRDGVDPEEILKWLESKGISTVADDDAEKALELSLFNMVLGDEFYYRFRALMLNQTKPLKEIAKGLSVDVNDLTDFIAVASNAKMSGDKLFEARYHMFLRGIEGVYVTLAPDNHLFVRKMETYKDDPNSDDIGYKVYAISFCHNCNATFIVGQVENKRLVQKSKFSDEYSPEVYLLEGEYEEFDLEEPETDDKKKSDVGETFVLCSKCGAIDHATSVNGLHCGHDKKYHNIVRKVKDKGAALHSCPCCHVVNTQRSIIRPYFLGNEAATSVIATGLYNVLPASQVTKKTITYEDEFFGGGIEQREEISEKTLVKQFLTFSDNRQAAAFFASYLQNTYRSSLIKRIMTRISEDNAEDFKNGISLKHFVHLLENELNRLRIGDKEERNKNAWLYVLKELINCKARNSLQNKGILYFDLDINMPANPKIGLNEKEVSDLFKILASSFVKKGAVKIEIGLTKAEINETFPYGIFGFSENHVKSKYIESWNPVAGRENARTLFLKQVFPDYSDEQIRSLLGSIWNILNKNGYVVFENDERAGRYLLSLDKIKVRKVNTLSKCNKCHTISPYSLKNICTKHKCDGSLEIYNFENETRNDHYANIYKNLNISDLIAKEHTAQLGSDKAYEYQNDFKREKINVLSCSTTFEMGVDVGTLETVFMRNMPPSPANYAQRAGRAGRSAKSAAYALTYCPNSSHDLNYFKNPVAMIKGTITPPAFNVDNEKIVLRHIFASAFSHFWQEYPDLFTKNIGEFFTVNGPQQFKDYLQTKPVALKKYLKLILSDNLCNFYGVDNFDWIEKLFSESKNEPGVFTLAYQKYQSEIDELEKAYEESKNEQQTISAGSGMEGKIAFKIRAIGQSLNTIKSQQLISFLSKNNLIPKYGFPVDTVELTSLNPSGGIIKSLSLDRDLFSAISEYAPDSEVVADGKLITSRYVRVLNGYSWPRYNYAICDSCQTLNRIVWPSDLPQKCRQCDKELPKRKSTYLIPKFGFVVDNENPVDVGTDKPERTYKGQISYIGDGKRIETKLYSVCDKTISVGTSKMDELAVLNTSNFYICDACGYGKIEETVDPVIEFTHHKSDGYPCSCKSLKRYSLGHEFQTDVVLLKFTSENVTEPEAAWTILYSLLEGLSKSLSIDRNELSGCLHWYRNESMGGIGNYGFVLFDNTPGGAGYVRQLKDVNIFCRMLKSAYDIVKNCSCGGEEADTACYACLCNYYNQKQHDDLKRKYAIVFLDSVRGGYNYYFGSYVESEQDNTETVNKEDSIAKRKAIFNKDGQDQTTMPFVDIWKYLADDTDDAEQVSIIDILSSGMTDGAYEKPFYSASLTLIDDKSSIYADLVWPKSKVLVFLKENQENYEIACNSDWTSFCLDGDFDSNAFLETIKL